MNRDYPSPQGYWGMYISGGSWVDTGIANIEDDWQHLSYDYGIFGNTSSRFCANHFQDCYMNAPYVSGSSVNEFYNYKTLSHSKLPSLRIAI